LIGAEANPIGGESLDALALKIFSPMAVKYLPPKLERAPQPLRVILL
jgi:hypothetical protein